MTSAESIVPMLMVQAAGQTFAVLAEQVRSLQSAAAADGPCRPLSAALGDSGGAVCPHVLWTRDRRAWGIEAVGDLTPVAVTDLRRLPAILARHASGAVWGVLVAGAAVILLLDLERLASNN